MAILKAGELPVGELVLTIDFCSFQMVFKKCLGLKRNNKITRNDVYFITFKLSCFRKSQ